MMSLSGKDRETVMCAVMTRETCLKLLSTRRRLVIFDVNSTGTPV